MERRSNDKGVRIEQRDGESAQISGYGAVFHREGDAGTEFRLLDDVVERIDPGAFNRALSEKHDVRGLFNHDANFVLGRVAAGTMRIAVDEIGLRYEIDIPETQAGSDVLTSVQRGDVSGSSFVFQVTGENWEKADKTTVRTITDVDLLEVGPVTFPAYKATSAISRAEFIADGLNAYDYFKDELARGELARARKMRTDEAIAILATIA